MVALNFPNGQPVTVLVGPGGTTSSPSFNATRYVDVETLRIEESGARETTTLSVDVLDKGPALTLLNSVIGPEGKIAVAINGQQVFLGYCRQPRVDWAGISSTISLTAYDIGSLLDKLVCYPRARRTNDERDKARIQWLLATYAQPFIQDGSQDFSKIQTLADASLDPQTFQNMTVRQAIEQVLGAASRSSNYYIDAIGRLHTFDADFPETDTAPYIIHATPSPAAGRVAPQDLQIEWDTADLVNFWVVRPKLPSLTAPFSDATSIAAYGLRQAYIDAPDANTVNKVTRVGNAALRDSKDPIPRGSFTVEGTSAYSGTSRWVAGQKVTITSAAHDITGEVYRITRNTISLLGGAGRIRNEIEFGGNKRPIRTINSGGAGTASLAGASLLAPVAMSITGGADNVRLMDATTGAGLVTTNTDPAIADIDPLTDALALAGTDVSFGAMWRREIQTSVLNGAWAVLPTNPTDPIISDPARSAYNALPGWYWHEPSDGSQVATMATGRGNATGNVFRVTSSVGATGGGYLEQLVPSPESYGQQYRAMLSAYEYVNASGDVLGYTWLDIDGGEVYSEATTAMVSGGETKIDCGLVPIDAAYLRIRYAPSTVSANHELAEVRVAWVPAEVPVNVYQATANVALGTSEAQIAGVTLPHATLTKGACYRVRVYGTVTNASGSNKLLTINCRIGTASLSGTVVATSAPNVSTGSSNGGFLWDVWIVVRTAGVTGTVFAVPEIRGDSGGPFANANSVDDVTGTSVINTTVVNILEVTASLASGASGSIRLASIVCENS